MPPAAMRSPSPGSESDDEMPGTTHAQDPASPPPPPRAPTIPLPPSRRPTTQDFTESPISDKRMSRGPPPPIPSIPPVPPRGKPGVDGESEYEGDYDTDIASGAKHKDALKAHTRDDSIDDASTFAEEPTPGRPVPPPPNHGRPVPPPPPPGAPKVPPRSSLDGPRGPPPLPPFVPMSPPGPPPIPTSPHEGDEDYDPFRYGALPTIPRSPSGTPGASAFIPPVPAPPPPPPRQDEEDEEEEEEDDLYAHPKDRPPPPPPPHQSAPPPIPLESPTSPRMGAGEFASPPRKGRQSTESMRRSIDQAGRPSMDRQGFIAQDVDLSKTSQWWVQPAKTPPVFQGRTDVLFETEESSTTKRGGKTTISLDLYVLFYDYSQTIVSVQYDAKNPADAQIEQRHEAPPTQPLRQDLLEAAYAKYGSRIAQVAHTKQNSLFGDGTPDALVQEMLKGIPDALPPVGTRAYGAAVYSNLANATVQQFDEIRPGDFVSFRNAKFQGKHGGVMHQKYSMEAGKPDHVAVVVEWDGTKKKIKAIEQGREGVSKKDKAKVESFRLGDLRSGEVRVWRVMGREWVGWASE
jgi:hypothetical protein